MNNKILTFIIGALTGAIVTTLIFMFVIPNNGQGNMPPGGMGGFPGGMGEPPEHPEGIGTPPNGMNPNNRTA